MGGIYTTDLKCKACGAQRNRVLESRGVEDGSSVRRRRECEACGHRFTTYECEDHVSLAMALDVIQRAKAALEEAEVAFTPESIERGLSPSAGEATSPESATHSVASESVAP